ncbi:MAG: WYL domain-containing protein [Candidatus Cyclonatronum sp.]|uniref:helix-turn-helix transcriptional regulator n=1 Tax=Cyclonatronum sp. TaxID=3024185 RepID=UPI0025C29A18|nr:WYL domain-containing protein [Cyclonatronum sp.]MCH8488009.1 WYL domain-containing protein [Cyclonatronum sp.]
MNSTERRLNLLLLLQSNRKWTVKDMANHFGVSRRTIFRDLATFSEINLPVTYDKEGGHGMMKGYSIPPIMFTPKELAIIQIGLSFVDSQVDETLVKDARAVQSKIDNVLPTEELKSFMTDLGHKTIVDPYKMYAAQKKKGGDWFTIANGISQHFEVVFDYVSLKDGNKEKRQVRPYLQVYYTDHWTLIGYDTNRRDIRSFRLDRMKNVQLTAQKFSGNNIPGVKSLLFRVKEESATTIAVLVSEKEAGRFRTSVPAEIDTEEIRDNGQLFRFRFDNLDYINEWLFTFHNEVKVLEPRELVEKRVMLIQQMLRRIG